MLLYLNIYFCRPQQKFCDLIYDPIIYIYIYSARAKLCINIYILFENSFKKKRIRF